MERDCQCGSSRTQPSPALTGRVAYRPGVLQLIQDPRGGRPGPHPAMLMCGDPPAAAAVPRFVVDSRAFWLGDGSSEIVAYGTVGHWEDVTGDWVLQWGYQWADGWTRPSCSGAPDTYLRRYVVEAFRVIDGKTPHAGDPRAKDYQRIGGEGAKSVTVVAVPEKDGWRAMIPRSTGGGDVHSSMVPLRECDLCIWRAGVGLAWCDGVKFSGKIDPKVAYIVLHDSYRCKGCLCGAADIQAVQSTDEFRKVVSVAPSGFASALKPKEMGALRREPSSWVASWSICPCSASRPVGKVRPPLDPALPPPFPPDLTPGGSVPVPPTTPGETDPEVSVRVLEGPGVSPYQPDPLDTPADRDYPPTPPAEDPESPKLGEPRVVTPLVDPSKPSGGRMPETPAGFPKWTEPPYPAQFLARPAVRRSVAGQQVHKMGVLGVPAYAAYGDATPRSVHPLASSRGDKWHAKAHEDGQRIDPIHAPVPFGIVSQERAVEP